jgi:hypothetical protein
MTSVPQVYEQTKSSWGLMVPASGEKASERKAAREIVEKEHGPCRLQQDEEKVPNMLTVVLIR